MASPPRSAEHAQKEFYTEDEYFEFSRTAEERWEFTPAGPPPAGGNSLGRINPVGEPSTLGRIRAMSGGTPDHSAIAANLIRTLGNALLPKGCRVFGSDLKVHTSDGVNTFPDVSVVCGVLTFYQRHKDIIVNPLLVVEVLSESTAGYDLGDKFAHYQTIPSLNDYLLVAQDRARAILHSRAGDHWETRLMFGLDGTVQLPSVDVTLALSDVYALIEFPEEGAAG